MFSAIVDLLEANVDKKVSSVIEQVIKLAEAKTGGGGGVSAYHVVEDVVVAVRCAYHKLFFDPRVVDFGAKTSSATGLSSMSKDGTAKWNAQYKTAKEAEAGLLTRLTAGEIEVADIATEQEAIATERAEIVPLEDGYGFATLEECLADSAARGL
jgi:hypothetical protein